MQLSLKSRIIGNISAILLLLISVIVFGLFRMKSITDEVKNTSKTCFSLRNEISSIVTNLDQQAYNLSEILLTGSNADTNNFKNIENTIKHSLRLTNSEFKNIANCAIFIPPKYNRNLQAKLKEAKKNYQSYQKQINYVLKQYEQKNKIDFAITLKNVDREKEKTKKSMRQMLGITESFNNNMVANIMNKDRVITVIVVIFALAIIIFGFGMNYFFIRDFTKPLQKSISVAKKIAAGDFDTKIQIGKQNELGTLLSALQNMRDTLKAEKESYDKIVHELQTEKTSVERKVQHALSELDAQKEYLEKNVEKILIEMKKFAQGDLTVNLSYKENDDIGKLFRGFNDAVVKVHDTLQQLSQIVISVASAVTQISSATEELAVTSQKQSLQTTDVASAVEEMTRTIIENSANAAITLETAKKEKSSAEHGREVVEKTVEIMKDVAEVVNLSSGTVMKLGKSSDQIGEIVSVIDDIADQTNLLALNASIEAARAGEQGKGFAVVADEVRSLADKTGKATKDIAEMIREIQVETKNAVSSMEAGTAKVNEGIQFVTQADEVLQEIVINSAAVTEKVTHIAVASEEQSTASEQISQNVESISTATQESASAMQQIAQTVEDLSRSIDQIQDMFNQFKYINYEEMHLKEEGINITLDDSVVQQELTETISSN